MSDLYYVRLYYKSFGSGHITLGWREAAKARDVYDAITQARRRFQDAGPRDDEPSRLFDIVDDFGNRGQIDLAEPFTIMLSSGQGCAELMNQLKIADIRGEMFLEALVNGDAELKKWFIQRQTRAAKSLMVPGNA